MEYRFQNNISGAEYLRAVRKTAFTSTGEKKDYHPHYEIYFCKKRRAQNITINGQSVLIDTPCIIISAPFSIHSMFPADREISTLERYVLYFGEKLLSMLPSPLLPEGFFESFSNCIFPLNSESISELEKIFLDILSENRTETEKALLFALFINALHRAVPLKARIAYGKASSYVIDALEYIYNNISKNISSDVLAECFHVSRAKLDRDFRRFLGRSPREAINDCRLACACDMLISSRLKISDIAASCGFDTEYYFYYFFKKAMGVTPLAYRKREYNMGT
jgi:AraC-like DNA-binding protein